jgi:hypothetical protein
MEHQASPSCAIGHPTRWWPMAAVLGRPRRPVAPTGPRPVGCDTGPCSTSSTPIWQEHSGATPRRCPPTWNARSAALDEPGCHRRPDYPPRSNIRSLHPGDLNSHKARLVEGRTGPCWPRHPGCRGGDDPSDRACSGAPGSGVYLPLVIHVGVALEAPEVVQQPGSEAATWRGRQAARRRDPSRGRRRPAASRRQAALRRML